MKKIIFILLIVLSFCTACKTKVEENVVKDKTIDYLMNEYVDGYIKGDYNKIQSVMPEYVYTDITSRYYKDTLIEEIKTNKETYGNDYKITYEIKEKELLDSYQLNKLNELVQNSFHINDQIIEGYYVSGTISYFGIESYTEEIFLYYVNYNNNWYLLFN